MLPTLTDLDVPTMRHEAIRHEIAVHERTALELRRVHRMQRWADRLERLSRRMSLAAYLRLARLP